MNTINIDEKQKKSLILILIIALILIGDFLFFMKPQWNILKAINPKLINILRDVKLAKIDIEQRSNFEKRYELARARMLYIEKQIPKDEEISPILDELSSISKENNVKITQLKPLKKNKEVILETDTGCYYRLPIYIDALCGYHQMGMFLNKIEYSNIFMKLIEIEIVQNKNDLENHQIRLVIDTFVIKK